MVAIPASSRSSSQLSCRHDKKGLQTSESCFLEMTDVSLIEGVSHMHVSWECHVNASRDPVRVGMISPLHIMPFGGIIVTCSSTEEAFEDANVGRAPGFCAYFRLFAMGSLSLPRFRPRLKKIISKSSPC